MLRKIIKQFYFIFLFHENNKTVNFNIIDHKILTAVRNTPVHLATLAWRRHFSPHCQDLHIVTKIFKHTNTHTNTHTHTHTHTHTRMPM